MSLPILLTVLGVFLLPILGSIFLYNVLVKKRNQMREGWSGIEVQLKRRHDLIPNLVACVKEVSNFEKTVLENVTEARANAQNVRNQLEAEAAEKVLVQEMAQFFFISEQYPELKSAESYRDLMDDLVEVEDHLQYARRYYNGSVRSYNNAVESFPSNIIASTFGFKRASFFEVEEVSERSVPKVDL